MLLKRRNLTNSLIVNIINMTKPYMIVRVYHYQHYCQKKFIACDDHFIDLSTLDTKVIETLRDCDKKLYYYDQLSGYIHCVKRSGRTELSRKQLLLKIQPYRIPREDVEYYINKFSHSNIDKIGFATTRQ
jgi:hypothetical protein